MELQDFPSSFASEMRLRLSRARSGSDRSSFSLVDMPKWLHAPGEQHGPRRRKLYLILLAVVAAIGVIGLCLSLGLGLALTDVQSDGSLGDGGPNYSEMPEAVVNLDYARYQGVQLRNGVNQFMGVRFAQPPLGHLRWRAPAEPEHEDEIQSAEEAGPKCLGTGHIDRDDEDEDCLYLNIWAPSDATPRSKLPVMVFIQGGGYVGNSMANQNGSLLVQTSGRNVILVDFNYRVGIWGFLASEDVKTDGDLNVGLLDQRFVLEWVQKHIHKFGGDPEHVVIDGSSAGAGSVATHLVAHGGRDDGLFAGAIGQSPFFPAQYPVSELEWQYDRVVEELDCSDAGSKMSCLREKDVNEIQEAGKPVAFEDRPGRPKFYWTPCIDGDLLQAEPSKLFRSGNVIQVPTIMGTCSNEASGFVPDAETQEEMVDFIWNNYPHLTSEEAEKLPEIYPLEDPVRNKNEWFPSVSRAYGEATFICPTNDYLNKIFSLANMSSQVWSYRYNVYDEERFAEGRGVPHVFENVAVFGPSMFDDYSGSYYTYNAPIVTQIQHYWLSFVRALDPNVHKRDDAPEWQLWNSTMSRLVMRTGDTHMEDVSSEEQDRCRFWQGLTEDTFQKG